MGDDHDLHVAKEALKRIRSGQPCPTSIAAHALNIIEPAAVENSDYITEREYRYMVLDTDAFNREIGRSKP